MALAKKPYVTLDAEILSSSVWSEAAHVRLVWITLLILCDTEGYVGASLPGIASAAGVTLQEAEDALTRFQEPDPYSRTKDNEGRRLEVAERGWRVLNFVKHIDRMSGDKARSRERVRRWRERNELKRYKADGNVTVRAGNREKGIGNRELTEERIPPPAVIPPAPKVPEVQVVPVWNREAAEDWFAAKGGAAPGRIFPALKRAVQAHGWERVRPVWRYYLATTGSEFVVVDKLVSAFGEWEKRMQGGRGVKAAVEVEDAPDISSAPRLATEFLEWRSRQKKQETIGQAMVRWLGERGIPFGKPLQVAVSQHVRRLSPEVRA